MNILMKIGIVRLGFLCAVFLFLVWLAGEYLIRLFKKKPLDEFKFLRGLDTPESWDNEKKRLMDRLAELEKGEFRFLAGAIAYSIFGLIAVVILELYYPEIVLSRIVLMSVSVVVGVWILLRSIKVTGRDLITRIKDRGQT
jgi:hypothetical protein